MPKKKIIPSLFEEKQKFFSEIFLRGDLRSAYLFYGDAGIGKKTFAKLFARSIETGKFLESPAPLIDMMELIPNEEGNTGIDEVRRARQFLSQTPIRSSRRILLVTAAETLTTEAQGAFLKIVEEPPQSALIIFIAQSQDALFSPLLSRLMKIYFPRLSKKVLAETLVASYEITKTKANTIAEHSYGRIARAEKLIADKQKKTLELPEKIAQKIVELRERDAVRFAPTIARLLELEVSVGRFNVNKRLQEKALEYILNS